MDPDPNQIRPSGTPPYQQQQQGQSGRAPQHFPGGAVSPQPHQRQESREESSPSPMPAPQGPPQLPPQLFTTAAQLLDLTDKKLVLNLRDGRKLIGVLRSWDQFANIVLQDTVERLYAGNLYCEIRHHGMYIVRGENVLLLGEVDLDKDDDVPPPFEKADVEVVRQLKEEEDAKRKKNDKRRRNHLQALGFEPDHSGEILF